MPKFSYVAKTTPRKTFRGSIEAESKKDAIHNLDRLGYCAVSVEEAGQSSLKEKVALFKKVSRRENIFFTAELATLMESGVNLLKALSILSGAARNRTFKAVLEDIMAKIKDGRTFSDSLAFYPQLFSGLYVSMVHSGEAGGHLEKALRRLADFLEKDEEFQSALRTALIYPFFILVLSAATIVILIGFVIPKLSAMFEDMGQILPWPTKFLMDTSGFLCRFGWLFLAAGVVFIFLLRRFYIHPQNKHFFDRLKLKLPLLGSIVLKTEISRLSRTLSVLLAGGIPIVHSLEMAQGLLGSSILKLEIQDFRERLARGESLSACLKGSRVFPVFVSNIVMVGEETGTLEKSLERVAFGYEKDVDRSLKTIIRLLEPVIILSMGLIVGFIVISMLLPIFQISIMAQ